MAEETTDKSIVVWYLGLTKTVPDAREITSLCLLHDQIVLCDLYYYGTGVDQDFQDYLEADSGYYCKIFKHDIKRRFPFINTIHLLAKQAIIQLLNKNEVSRILDVPMETGKHTHHPYIDECYCRLFTNKSGEDVEETEDGLAVALDFVEAYTSWAASKAYHYPIVTGDIRFQAPYRKTETLSEELAQSSICQLALPDVRAVYVEDILEARNELKDELLEFRAGILKLTWLLHQQVQNKNDLEQIRQEANILANTIIKGSLISLENRMRQHKKNTIRRMLFGTGRVLVEATKLFLPSGAAEKMISGGKTIFQLATEIDSAKLPEDQVATYLYKLREKFS